MNYTTNSVTERAAFTPNIYPLALRYSNADTGRKWSLLFQTQPEKKITRSGDMPTRDEIVESLSCLPFPVMMVQLCEIFAAVAEVVEEPK